MRLTLAFRPRYANGNPSRSLQGLGYISHHSSAVLPKNIRLYP
ncbi:hypothetical protein [Moorena sp. SIO3I6]|nr:hypothetical protein [Moorena sp. SIO3I6]